MESQEKMVYLNSYENITLFKQSNYRVWVIFQMPFFHRTKVFKLIFRAMCSPLFSHLNESFFQKVKFYGEFFFSYNFSFSKI